MMTFIRPRLRKPARTILAGTLFAAAWVVHGGNGWLWTIVTGVIVLVRAVTLYVRGGEDSDDGALAGSRPDERQQLVAQRSWALLGKTAMIAAFAGLTAAIAVRAIWWWPFAAMIAVMGLAYLYGLSIYGVAEEGTADDADAMHQARSPVS